jgi:hypothetical protein
MSRRAKSITSVSKTRLKYLHLKKEKLTWQLHSVHLKAAQEWGNSWFIIVDSIHESINYEMQTKYKSIHQKLQKLEKKRLPPLNFTKNSSPGSLITHHFHP